MLAPDSDPRIEEAVDDIDDEVHDDHCSNDKQDSVLDDVVVALQDGLSQEPAKAGVVEDGLNEDGPSNCRPDEEPKNGHEGQKGRLCCMPEDDLVLRQARFSKGPLDPQVLADIIARCAAIRDSLNRGTLPQAAE